MEARLIRSALLAATLFISLGARYPTANFIVETADPGLAAQIGQTAEKYRHELAIAWLGQPIPNWAQPCLMTVQVAPHLGAGGATTFVFDRGEVFSWRMTIQGSAQRVLDSVLPHEITHMIFASHFRRPLPRWADEGGATSVEDISEKQKHRTMLVQFLQTGRGIAMNQMFAMSEYPRDVMPLYAQGYSLSEYLIAQGGRRKFVEFLGDGMRDGQWSEAVQRHYGIADLVALQNEWVGWVAKGFPLPIGPGRVIASDASAQPIPATSDLAALPRRARPEPNLIYHVHDRSGAMAAVPAGFTPAPMEPPSGWRSSQDMSTAGAAPPPPGEASPEEVSRTPTMEPSQQIIVE